MKIHKITDMTDLKKNSVQNVVPQSSIERMMEDRSSSITNLKNYWERKIGTEDQQLGFVAIEILGLLITSVLTERSFSKSRYIIHNLRTNISDDHARDQMIIKCNREISIKVLESINIFINDDIENN